MIEARIQTDRLLTPHARPADHRADAADAALELAQKRGLAAVAADLIVVIAGQTERPAAGGLGDRAFQMQLVAGIVIGIVVLAVHGQAERAADLPAIRIHPGDAAGQIGAPAVERDIGRPAGLVIAGGNIDEQVERGEPRPFAPADAAADHRIADQVAVLVAAARDDIAARSGQLPVQRRLLPADRQSRGQIGLAAQNGFAVERPDSRIKPDQRIARKAQIDPSVLRRRDIGIAGKSIGRELQIGAGRRHDPGIDGPAAKDIEADPAFSAERLPGHAAGQHSGGKDHAGPAARMAEFGPLSHLCHGGPFTLIGKVG